MGILTSITKIAAAAKVVVTARYFGASDDLDAFLIAFLLPQFVVETVTGTFTTSLVPRLIRSRSSQDQQVGTIAQASLALVLGAMSALMVLLALTARWLLPLLGSSFSSSKLDLTFVLFLSMLIWLPISACSATWRAVLNAHGRLAMATAVYMASPVITMLFLAGGAARWGVWVLAVANMSGALLEFVALAVGIRRLGYSLRPSWLGWTPDMRALLAQYWPLLAGTTITAGCALVDQAVAGALGSGSVAALSYGVKVAGVLIAVGGTGMATAVLPEFSRLVSQGRWDALRHALRLHVGVAMAVMIPVTVLLMWGSAQVVRVIYQGGQFDATAAAVVSQVQWFSLLMVPFAVVLLIAQRLSTALGASGLILRAGFVAMLVNVTGDWLLPRWFGVGGVGLASALGHIVFMAGLVALLYLKEPRLFRTVKP